LNVFEIILSWVSVHSRSEMESLFQNFLVSKIKEIVNKELTEKVDRRIEDKNSPLTQKLDQLSVEVKNISTQMAAKNNR
jgi:hypothetical protein